LLRAQLLAEKEQAAKRLDTPKVKSAPTDVTITIGSGEKTNDFKLSSTKHATTRDEEETQKLPVMTKSKFLEADVAITKDIVERERVIRTRTSILQSNKKHFTSIITTVSNQLKKDEQKKQADQKRKIPTYDRYQEVQEDKFWKERLKGNEPEEFQIDTRGTFADSGRMPDVAQLSVTKPAKTRKVAVPLSKSSSDQEKQIPIIVVPGALTSLITIYNAKDFLAEGSFIPSLDKKNSGTKKENSIILERKKANINTGVRYQIMDNVAKMSSKDWNRVIAVFALGASWQFKNWQWSAPVEIFSRVRGFYLHYEDEAIPDTIRSWDVKVLTVSKAKSKKHLAQTAAVEFWNAIDIYLRSKKPDQFDPLYY